jgi:predicted RNase H-like HicB family nuclease
MEHRFTAVFERDGDWWIAYVEELPGPIRKGELSKKRAKT